MDVKFYYNGIKADGVFTKCSFGRNIKVEYVDGERVETEMIAVYGAHYNPLPNIGWEVENGTDYMTDYFENDHVHIPVGGKWYAEAYEAWKQGELKLLSRVIAKIEKRIASGTERRGDKMYLNEYKERIQKIA